MNYNIIIWSMMTLLIWIAVFLVSLIVLSKSADYFTESAEKIGLHLKMPLFFVGVTIVAIGTSLPELASSIVAVMSGASEIVSGNVIGSNITNIFLVLGFAAVFCKRMKIGYELIHVDLPILVGSAFLFAASVWDGVFSFGEGILFLGGLVLYIVYTAYSLKEKEDTEIKKEMKDEVEKELKDKGSNSRKKLGWKHPLILLITAVLIYFSAKYTVESIIKLSGLLNLGTEIIAVSAVALGTSLPELVVSISAARKGKPEIAVGNVLGSNIFNTFAVMGIPALLGPLVVPDSILFFSLPLMVIATVLYYFITEDNKITKWEGWLLLIFYVFFIAKLFNII